MNDGSSDTPWDRSCDVAVVGFGAAGASAAIEAAESGADVLIIERFTGGGASAISGGVVYAGGGTHIQAAAGVEDDVEAMFAYLSQEVGEVVSEATLQRFCDQSAENLRWLEAHGVPFEPSLCPVKTSYPSDKYFLYYSGNEGFSPYADHALPAPRGHRAKGKGLPGANFYAPLKQSALDAGAKLQDHSRAVNLVVENGRVVGVELSALKSGWQRWLHGKVERMATKINPYMPRMGKRLRRWNRRYENRHGQRLLVQARRGVILSTGGFIYNRQRVRQEAPGYRRGFPLGTDGCDGSGIALGESIGGATAHMDRVSAWRFINPPLAFAEGIMVDGKGARYVNEALYGAAIGEAMVERAEGRAILILDNRQARTAKKQVGRGKTHWFQTAPTLLNLWTNARKGDSLEALAQRCKMDPGVLAASVSAYNEAIAAKQADPLGKPDGFRSPIEQGPFLAIDCSISSRRFPCPTLTLGGLVVNEETGEVQNGQGQGIVGLYAAGRAAVGICTRQYVSGLSLADCVFSGRRAGRSTTIDS
jgi:3-oxo-5alpha-steroid 4-dehydrogenase